jgi:hypothetical protein
MIRNILLILLMLSVGSCNLNDLKFAPDKISSSFPMYGTYVFFLPQQVSVKGSEDCRVKFPVVIADYGSADTAEYKLDYGKKNFSTIQSQLLNGSLTTLLEYFIDSAVIRVKESGPGGKQVLVFDQATIDSDRAYYGLINFYNRFAGDKNFDLYGCASSNKFLPAGFKKYFSANGDKETFVKAASYLMAESYGHQNTFAAVNRMITDGLVENKTTITLLTADDASAYNDVNDLIAKARSRGITINIICRSLQAPMAQAITSATGGFLAGIPAGGGFYSLLGSLPGLLQGNYTYYDLYFRLDCTKPYFTSTPDDYTNYLENDFKITTPDSATITSYKLYFFP